MREAEEGGVGGEGRKGRGGGEERGGRGRGGGEGRGMMGQERRDEGGDEGGG